MNSRVKALILAWVLFGTVAIASEPGWEPQKTWVFVVGLLEWKNSDTLASFPKKGRRDTMIAEWFKKRGVPSDHVHLMQDKKATTAAVRTAFDEFLERTGKNDTLFVYYCGHGYSDDRGITYFATYDAGKTAWAVPELFNAIEKHYHGARAILTADCCESGALSEEAKKRRGAIEYACLASVLAGETSTGCWTFSDSLLDALEGAPQVDRDGDGIITFQEATQYIKDEMAFFDEQTASSAHSSGLDQNWRLAITSRPKANKRIGEHVEVEQNGDARRAQIDDFKNGEFKVRFASTAEREEAWVSETQLRSLKAVPKNDRDIAAVLKIGAAVKAEWHKRWWAAKILKIDETKSNKYYISYDGYDADWNEWVPLSRLKK